MRGLFAETRAGVETPVTADITQGTQFHQKKDLMTTGIKVLSVLIVSLQNRFLSHKFILLFTISFQGKHVSDWKSHNFGCLCRWDFNCKTRKHTVCIHVT